MGACQIGAESAQIEDVYRRALLICALTVRFAAAQEFPFIHIDGPGAPKGSCFMLEDSRGGMWFAGAETGAEGLWYFDGVRFSSPFEGTWTKSIAGGLVEDSEGGIILASAGGLNRLHAGRVERVAEGDVVSLHALGNDVFLAGLFSASGPRQHATTLIRMARMGQGWRIDRLLTTQGRVRLSLDSNGQVLFGCDGGYCEIRASAIRAWTRGSELAVSRHFAATKAYFSEDASMVLRDRFGCVWMRNVTQAAYICPGEPKATDLPAGLVSTGTPLILQLADGTIVLPGFGKVAMGRPGNFRVLTSENGYPSAGASLVTRDGSIWLSNANGLFVMRPSSGLEYWSERDGLEYNTWAVTRAAGRMFAIAGDSVRVLDQDRTHWTRFAETSRATSLIEGPHETILVGSSLAGISQFDSGGRLVARSRRISVYAMAKSADGRYWAVGDGIRPVSFGKEVRIGADVAQGSGIGADMKTGSDGVSWAVVGNRLWRLDNAGWHSGASPILEFYQNRVSLTPDRSGGLWIALTAASRLLYLPDPLHSPGKIYSYPSGAHMGVVSGTSIGMDRRGWLWRGSPDGIYVADLDQARRGDWVHLDREYGLPGVDANQKSWFADEDGSVWFGVDSSVIHIKPPDDWVHPRTAPAVFISEVATDTGPAIPGGAPATIINRAKVNVRVGTNQVYRRRDIRIRYRLIPGDGKWHEGNGLELQLGQLPSGERRLEVQGSLFTGPWSSTVAQALFVAPPDWVTRPYLLLYFVLIGSLLASAYWILKTRKDDGEDVLPNLAAWRLEALVPGMTELAGTVIDERFEVRQLLARGGFGNVFRGFDRGRNEDCAVKVFRSDVKSHASVNRGFEQEVAALKQVRHPNVVAIYADGTTESGTPYLVMEYVDGRTLREVLKAGALAPERVARLLEGIASALDAIHMQRICHRDLTPDNIMVRAEATPDEAPVLIDFSIAIVKDANETLHGMSRAAGTFDYMAPEQAMGYAQPSSDIYSLARVVIEMMTGKTLKEFLPNAALDLPEKIPAVLGRLNVALSAESVGMISRALEFDPNQRPAIAGEFARPIVRDLAPQRARSGGAG